MNRFYQINRYSNAFNIFLLFCWSRILFKLLSLIQILHYFLFRIKISCSPVILCSFPPYGTKMHLCRVLIAPVIRDPLKLARPTWRVSIPNDWELVSIDPFGMSSPPLLTIHSCSENAVSTTKYYWMLKFRRRKFTSKKIIFKRMLLFYWQSRFI